MIQERKEPRLDSCHVDNKSSQSSASRASNNVHFEAARIALSILYYYEYFQMTRQLLPVFDEIDTSRHEVTQQTRTV